MQLTNWLNVMANYQLSYSELVFAFLIFTIVGLSKSGIKGISILVVTTLALLFGSKASTGILLPMFIVGDIFAVTYYRKHTQWKHIIRLMPWMILGVLLGVWFGKDLSEFVFKRGMALIILLTITLLVWWEYRPPKQIPDNQLFAGLMGIICGFTTMVGNLAGAFSSIYFLAMRLPKDEFIGTAAWLFFIINLFKLPFHIFVWHTITPESIGLNIWMIPAVWLGFIVGVRLVKLIKDYQYRRFVLVMTALGAILIFFR